MKIQITLYSTTGKYKPVSTIIEVENIEEFKQNKNKYYKKAILNICHNRYTTWDDLKKDGYTIVKYREYDREKIELQNKINKLKKIMEERKNKKNIDK